MTQEPADVLIIGAGASGGDRGAVPGFVTAALTSSVLSSGRYGFSSGEARLAIYNSRLALMLNRLGFKPVYALLDLLGKLPILVRDLVRRMGLKQCLSGLLRLRNNGRTPN